MVLTLLVGLGIFLADRLLKMYVLHAADALTNEAVTLIPGVLQLTYTENTGMAFGFLASYQWIPLVITPLILGGLGVLLAKNKFPCRVQRLALVCVMAGGVGNWVDRLLYGFVVDMLEPIFIRFAVFNLADVFITVGGFVFVVAYVVSEWQTAQAKRKTSAEPSGE